MKHVQEAKALPRPIFYAVALALFSQIGYGNVGSGGEQFVIVFIRSGQPPRGPVGEDFLQKRGAPPLIKMRVFTEERLEEEVDGRPARCMKKRNFRGAGI